MLVNRLPHPLLPSTWSGTTCASSRDQSLIAIPPTPSTVGPANEPPAIVGGSLEVQDQPRNRARGAFTTISSIPPVILASPRYQIPSQKWPLGSRKFTGSLPAYETGLSPPSSPVGSTLKKRPNPASYHRLRMQYSEPSGPIQSAPFHRARSLPLNGRVSTPLLSTPQSVYSYVRRGVAPFDSWITLPSPS